MKKMFFVVFNLLSVQIKGQQTLYLYFIFFYHPIKFSEIVRSILNFIIFYLFNCTLGIGFEL